MNVGFAQRWRERRDSYRPAGEPIDPTRYGVDVVPEGVARAFVQAHHYSASFPAARLSQLRADRCPRRGGVMASKKKKAESVTLVQRPDGKWTVREQPDFSGAALRTADGRVLLLDRRVGRGRDAIERALGFPCWKGSAGKDRNAPVPVYGVPRSGWATATPVAHLLGVVKAAASATCHLRGSDEEGWTLVRSGAKLPMIWRGRSGPWKTLAAPGVRAPTALALLATDDRPRRRGHLVSAKARRRRRMARAREEVRRAGPDGWNLVGWDDALEAAWQIEWRGRWPG